MRNTLGVAAICGAVVLAGCAPQTSSNPSGTPGPAERAGAALDRAADKTVETTTNAAAKAVDKTGEVIEKAGAAVEKVGADMQK